MADCTPEQKALVEEILSVKRTDYYRVLKVDKNANDVEIKKSYRKLAIKLHPDKNKHPKAAEAFKVIAKAFEVLGDESKRKMYDMTGSDPDSRGGMRGNSGEGMDGFAGFQGFQGFQGFPPGAGMGQGNINEDILNMLFGMGAMGGGNGFSFNFGGNGFPNNGFYYSNTPGMNARRRAQQQQQQQRTRRNNSDELPWTQYLIQFLPLIIIMFSILINSFGSGSTSDGYRNVREFHGSVPRYVFQPVDGMEVERTTPRLEMKYYVSENTMKDFEGRKNPEKELAGLDKFVENKYLETLNYGCIREKNIKREMQESAQGIFFTDWDKLERADKMEMPNCDKLASLNLL